MLPIVEKIHILLNHLKILYIFFGRESSLRVIHCVTIGEDVLEEGEDRVANRGERLVVPHIRSLFDGESNYRMMMKLPLQVGQKGGDVGSAFHFYLIR